MGITPRDSPPQAPKPRHVDSWIGPMDRVAFARANPFARAVFAVGPKGRIHIRDRRVLKVGSW